MPKYAAASATFLLGKYEEAFRYAALALDLTTNPDLRSQIREFMQKIPANAYNENCSPLDKRNIEFISNK